MHNISIANLFNNNNNNKITYKPLDVYSLSEINKELNSNINNNNNKKKNILNIDKLKHVEQERKKQIVEQYEKIYNNCLNKINLANNLHRIWITHEIPLGIWGLVDYNPTDCLKYIEEKLNEIYIDTIILSINIIYISWNNLRTKNK